MSIRVPNTQSALSQPWHTPDHTNFPRSEDAIKQHTASDLEEPAAAIEGGPTRNVSKTDEEHDYSKFWTIYGRVSRMHDDGFLSQSEYMDIISIWASILSAVSSSFIAGMQPNMGDTMGLSSVRDISGPFSSTVYSSYNVWTQIFAYASLTSSLLAVFVAVLGRQWLNCHTVRGLGSLKNGQRQSTPSDLKNLNLLALLLASYVLLQISLLLFGLLLSVVMLTQPITISIIIIYTTTFGIFFYNMTPQSPLLSPLFKLLRQNHEKQSSSKPVASPSCRTDPGLPRSPLLSKMTDASASTGGVRSQGMPYSRSEAKLAPSFDSVVHTSHTNRIPMPPPAPNPARDSSLLLLSHAPIPSHPPSHPGLSLPSSPPPILSTMLIPLDSSMSDGKTLETSESDEEFMTLDPYGGAGVFTESTRMSPYPSGSVSPAFTPTLNLHWQLLSYHPARPNLSLHFDVAFPTHDIEYVQDSSYGIQRTPQPDADLDKPAADKKLTKMTINFQCCPFNWDIDVEREEGIRARDVFEAIYSAFDLPLTLHENHLIPPRLRAGCEEAFKLRCSLAPVLPIVQQSQGLKRVDVLLHETIFRGLAQSKRGDWTLHLSGTASKAIDRRHPISDHIVADLAVRYRARGVLWDPILELDTTASHSLPTPPALEDPREYLSPYHNQNPNVLPNYSNDDLFNLPLSAALVPRKVMGSNMMLPSRVACRICNFARLSAILQHETLCTLLNNRPPLTTHPLSQDYTWAFFCRFVPIGALFDSPGRGALPAIQLGSDRARLVDSLEAHFESPSNAMLWLHGPSGTGKSVIAYTLASRCRHKNILAGSFVFSPKHAHCRSARSLVIVLAYQLGLSQPQAKEKMIEVLDRDPGIISPSRDLREQFARLLIDPLEAVDWRSPSRVFIIDAIDQCQDQVPELISLLSRLLSHMNDVGLHIFFTSRDYIKGVLIKRQLFPMISDIALDDSGITRDIGLFLRRSFDKIHKRHQLQCPKPWPPEETLGRLVDRVGSHFITGSIIVKFVGSLDSDPTDRMDLIDHIFLNPSSPSESSVDDFYKSIISTADDPEQAYLHLTIVVNLAGMLSYPQLDNLLNRGSNRKFDMRSALSQLSPLVHTPDGHDNVVQVGHESLCDFLSDPIRCGEQFISQVVVHRLLAYSSLSIMMKELPDDSPLCSRLSQLATESDFMSLRVFDNAVFLSLAMCSPPEPLLYLSMLWHITQGQYTGLQDDSRTKLALQYFCHTWQVLQHLDLSAVDALPAFRFLVNIRSLPVLLAFPIFLAFESPRSGQTLGPSTLEYDHRVKTLDVVAEIVADVHALKDQRKTDSDALDYACTHWAYHLSLAEWDDDLRSIVTAFMRQRLQQWVLKAWCLQDLETCLRTLCGVRELCLANNLPIHFDPDARYTATDTKAKQDAKTVSLGGCWTCRLRKKKCDEQQKDNSCRTCDRLRIDCLGWGTRRPEWMDHPKAVEDYRAGIKAQIKRTRRGQPRLSIGTPMR